MAAHFREELARREVKGDVGLAISIKDHHVVVPSLRVEPVPGVRDDRVNVGLVEMEVPMRDVKDVGIDFHPRDLNLAAKCRCVLAGRGSTREAEDGHIRRVRFGRLCRPEGIGDHHVVPRTARKEVLRVVDGVDGLPLIEDELCLRADLHHLYVVVGGLLLKEERTNLRRLDPCRQENSSQDNGECERRVQAPSRPERDHRHDDERKAEALQRRTGAVGRDEPESRKKSAKDAAAGGERVDPTRRVAARLHVLQEQADGEGADTTEQDDRDGKKQHHREQCACHQAHAQVLEPLLRREQDRIAHQRDESDPESRPGRELVEDLVARVAVGEAPADDVARRKVDEDEADEDSPHVKARAEVRCKEA